MPMYAENFVEELKDRVDLYDLISPYVQLKKKRGKMGWIKPIQPGKNTFFLR